MNAPKLPWLLFIAGKPPAPYSEPLVQQAQSLTATAKICCLIDEAHRDVWRDLSRRFWQSNVFASASGEPIIAGVKNVLITLMKRDPGAGAVLIPINHCAVEESTWLASTQGAVRLGVDNPDTVYMLHDKPDNDPRIALNQPEICSSSVMVGSVRSLLDLCYGKRTTAIVDLVVQECANGVDPRPAMSQQGDAALKVVHIRLVEEYARLQRGDYTQRKTGGIDLRA